MNRSSLTYLVVGLLAGALLSGAINASALVPSGSHAPAGAGAQTPAQKTAATKKKAAAKKAALKRKAAAKKKKTKKKKPKMPAPPPPPPPATTTTTGIPLNGLFRITPGAYANGQATGSHIRLVLPGGSVERGPFFPNPNSRGGTFTLLAPGTDGGLRTGSFQEPPSPPFSPVGDALSGRIIAPQRFAAILYSASTSRKDPQTAVEVPAPAITVSDGKLSGRLQAVSASWNRAFFNQGSPKPDGSSPGLTSPVTGTYDADTKAYTLDWTSQIVGGPFNNFSGHWHFEGVFEPTC
ncbi:MAG TPA: hypothetical protein VGO80_21675 [Solirubrobacteraceae bacterium]|jgi:hypothetical protein|nr:hypothetical protein [Solirubrobacteraceae bacterium]